MTNLSSVFLHSPAIKHLSLVAKRHFRGLTDRPAKYRHIPILPTLAIPLIRVATKSCPSGVSYVDLRNADSFEEHQRTELYIATLSTTLNRHSEQCNDVVRRWRTPEKIQKIKGQTTTASIFCAYSIIARFLRFNSEFTKHLVFVHNCVTFLV